MSTPREVEEGGKVLDLKLKANCISQAESKESVEITDLGKHKKRVGIHTDITFEITAEGEGNETSSAQQQGEKGK